MTDINLLLSIVEAATGRDREIEARVWCYFEGVKYRSHNPVYSSYGEDNPLTQVQFTRPPKRSVLVTGAFGVAHATPVTSSIDATVALIDRVMPGTFWLISKGRLTAAEPLYAAALMFGSDEILGEAEAHSAPLAILTALLRANIAESEAS